MGFCVLGPFGVFRDGKPVRIDSMQVRALIAVLLLAPGQRASHDYIAKRLWSQSGWAPENIRSCFTKLRRKLPEITPPRNPRNFCEIEVPRGDVDYFRFRDGVEEAGRQRGAERVETLRAALSEWLGDPLGDLFEVDLSAEKVALNTQWRNASITYLRAMLEIGDSAGFVAGMRTALGRWPDDEKLFEIKLRALAESGRKADIEQVFDERGKEYGPPSKHLMEVYGRLTGESLRPGLPAAESIPRAVPQQLPVHRPSLIGRDAQLEELSDVLLRESTSMARLVVLSGMAGVGKTQLALYWAASVKDAFSGGVLYTDLNGFASTEPERPEQILARMLDDLGVCPATATMDGMITAYRSTLASRAVLVVLDNARDANQVRPLLPGAGSCAAVITSRDRMDSLVVREGAHAIAVDLLSPVDAATLLTADLGEASVRAGGHYIDELVELCGRLPLALSVVAAKARTRPPDALRDLVRTLRVEKTRLDSLEHRTDDLNVRLALAASQGTLSPAAAELFRLLAIHPGPTISWPALVALGDNKRQSVLCAVNELLAANLLEEPSFDRFAYHDLIRVYAGELADTMTREDRERAVDRAFGFLLHNTWACDKVLVPGRLVPIGEPDGVDVIAPSTPAEAMAWLDAEYATVTAAIQRAHELGSHRYTWLLTMALTTFQWRRNRFADAERYLVYAAAAAEQVAGPADQAMIYRMLAGSRRGMKNFPLAKASLLRAIALSEEADDALGVAHGRHGLAVLHRECAEPQAATEHYEHALAAFRELGDILGEAGVLNGLGCVRHDLGEHEEALRYCAEALCIFETTADVNSQANALADLGRIHAARGDHSLAVADFRLAVAKYRDLTYTRNEAMILIALSDALIATNCVDKARKALRRAVDLLRELGVQGADEATARLADLG
jgi:tetratricopeptide (TPR) repeat protein